DIPHSHHAVAAAHRKELVIRRENHARGAVHGLEIANHFSGRQLPQAKIIIELGVAGKVLAIRRKNQTGLLINREAIAPRVLIYKVMPAQFVSGFQVPVMQRAVRAGAEQLLARSGEMKEGDLVPVSGHWAQHAIRMNLPDNHGLALDAAQANRSLGQKREGAKPAMLSFKK